jgi:hypothetical protein
MFDLTLKFDNLLRDLLDLPIALRFKRRQLLVLQINYIILLVGLIFEEPGCFVNLN